MDVNLGLIGLGYLAFSGLCGAAALTPSMAQAASVSHAKRYVGPGQLAIMAVGLLVGPTVLFIEAASGAVTTGAGIAIVSAAIGVLVLVRLSLFSGAYRRRVRREQAMRTASRALVMATTPGDVINGLTAALDEMVAGDAWLQVQLVDRGAPHTREATLSPCDNTAAVLASGGRSVGELTIPIHSQASNTEHPEYERKLSQVMVFTAPMDQLVELSPLLQTLAQQAGSALKRIDLVAKVRAAEREHYFRTLVLTSTDVTLISRNGRIDYATPSAETTFGRDVRGALFADLVYHHPPGHADADKRWSDEEKGAEGYIQRSDGTALTVVVDRRDLTADPTVHGVVTTLRDMTAEREAQRHLAYRASHDALTGLAKADRFRDELRADNDAAAVANTLSAVLFVDLDDFKSVNDTFGHEIGDGVLRTAAHRIRVSLRDGDVAARMGGDEFAILLRDVPNPDIARAVTQRLSDNLASPATVSGVNLDCQASIGLALARTTDDRDSVLRRADTALYTAKAAGKGSWRQYQDNMLNPARRRADQRATIKNLIRHDELTVRYQPIVELATGRTAGFEALLCTIRPAVDGDLSASVEQLVRAADETGLMVQLGDRVLAQALTDVLRFNPPGAEHKRYVSANVSACQLRQRNFVDHVRDLMTTSGMDPSLLVLEITENFLINADEREWAYLGDLRRDGVRVAIDDYGTGDATVSYLRQTGIDIVKIDRGLIRNIQSAQTQTLLDALITLAINLGLDAIAEGVEDRQTRDTLVALGCRYGQGVLYAPPMPIGKAITVSGCPGQ